MQDFLNKHKSTLKLLGLGLLVLALSACSTPSATGNTATVEDGRYDYVLTVDIAANDSQTEIERTYEGEAVVFRPEAGFAVLGLKHGEFTTLNTDAEGNIEAVTSPVTAAGNDSWAGGNDSWAGGTSVWSVTGDLVGDLGKNDEEFAQVNLVAGQALAPNLGAGVVVAVLDTGVDLDHPALQGKLSPTSTWKDFVDGDAYPNDDAASSDSDNANKGQGHGTAAAGIILQVAPNATIMPVRVLHPNGGGDFTDIAAGIDWAIAQGADVLNLSLGSVAPSPTIQALLTYAASQGVYVLASTGNSGDGNVTHPASGGYDNAHGDYVIGVGSVDKHDIKSNFSTYSSDVEMVAPGEKIYTFGPDGKVMHVTGTSFATPMVAGTLALGLGELASLPSNDTVTNMLSASSSASIYVGKNSSYLNQLGQGRLDVEAFMISILASTFGVGL